MQVTKKVIPNINQLAKMQLTLVKMQIQSALHQVTKTPVTMTQVKTLTTQVPEVRTTLTLLTLLRLCQVILMVILL